LVDAGARVIAVELHTDRAAGLERRFAGEPVTVVRADAADLRLPRRPFKVVANPPFAITTALLRRLTGPRSRLERAALILPSWAATRWAGGRGVGGLALRRTYDLAIGGRVPVTALHPRPPAPPTILVITRRRASAPHAYQGRT
jgi:23S rRNA (adenine-N6)-dimethyltransferase